MKNTVSKLVSKKNKELVTCLTAYDYTAGKILDEAGIDIILVGDSVGTVVQGCPTTVEVTLDEMIYHGKLVRKGVLNALLVVDMPFGTYSSIDTGIDNAIKILKKTGADAIKLEGAEDFKIEMIKRMTAIGISVVGHIGLEPQKIKTEGYKVQGYSNFEELIGKAKLLEEAGCEIIVLEGLNPACAKEITDSVKSLTIGIGAGRDCDGQVLVFHDIFGLFDDFKPKFVKRYLNLKELITLATCEFIQEVKAKEFPGSEYIYKRIEKNDSSKNN